MKPHYKGTFEVFRTEEGEQYARLEMMDKSPGSYVWFKFDFFTESYQSFDSEIFPDNNKTELQMQLEEEYQEIVRPMKEYLKAIYEACSDE